MKGSGDAMTGLRAIITLTIKLQCLMSFGQELGSSRHQMMRRCLVRLNLGRKTIKQYWMLESKNLALVRATMANFTRYGVAIFKINMIAGDNQDDVHNFQ